MLLVVELNFMGRVEVEECCWRDLLLFTDKEVVPISVHASLSIPHYNEYI